MNKLKISLIAVFLTLFSFAAHSLALGMDPNFYIGIEGQGNRYKSAKSVKDNDGDDITRFQDTKNLFSKGGAGFGGFIGTNLNEYLGLEVGFLQFKKKKIRETDTVTPAAGVSWVDQNSLSIKQNNIYLDLLGYVPIDSCFKFIATVGVGRLNTKFNNVWERTLNVTGFNPAVHNDTFTKTYHKAGIRLGLGASYLFTDNVGARVMARYQKGNTLIKNVSSLGLGLFFQF